MSVSAAAAGIGASRAGEPSYRWWVFAAIAALTGLRLLWLSLQSAGLYPDEAQYWFWAQHPAFGYYSKPPLVAWLIALTTGIIGNSEFAIRLSAPLLHAATAAIVYLIGARLYDRRTGFWASIAYLTLPGVSLSAFIISTDAPLLLGWAVALYAFIRAREGGHGGWWLIVGVSAGLGLLAKYAMAYWMIAALGLLLLIPSERRYLKALLGALALAVLIYLPNLWWNWSNGFVSYLHVRDNAELRGSLIHPGAFVEFLASQFGVFGPIFFGALLVLLFRFRPLTEPRARLLAIFGLPALALMLCLSLLSRAQPNWAAPTYVSAIVLVVAWMLQRHWHRLVAASMALNLVAAVTIFCSTDALAVAGIAVPAKYDPLHRLRGWRQLGAQVSALMAAHPDLQLAADDREILASLIYYVRPHPFGAVEWNPLPGISDQWRLTNNIGKHRGEDFLIVSVHGWADTMRAEFTEVTPLPTIRIDTGPNGGMDYAIHIARGFRGAGDKKR